MVRVETPPDVLYKVMDFVSARQTLLSCAISGRALCRPSQRKLFTSINISYGPNLSKISERWEKFGKALSTSSDLGQHVKSLRVLAILLTDQTILSFFSKIRNLSEIIIEGGTYHAAANDSAVMPWIRLQSQTRHFLSQDVFPRLTSLRLLDLTDIPAEILEYLTSIRSLECSDNILPLSEDFPQDLPKTMGPHSLKRLDLRRSWQPENVGYMALANYFRRHNCQLQEVSLFHVDPDLGTISLAALKSLVELLATSKASLQALYMDGQERFLMGFRDEADSKDWFKGFYDLSQYTALTTLAVNLSLGGLFISNDQINVYVQRLVEIFQSGGPTQTSAGLQIVCVNAEFPSSDDRQMAWWSPIVHALSTISTVKKLYFNISLINLGDFGDWYESEDYERRLYSEGKTALEDALKNVGMLEKSEIALNRKWDLAVHKSFR
ncbi:hypothetical protein DL96DRAFT_1761152 [Flagelloscypha sp. PMI_526]|nr:hypothetical protein DL96DRAFT_1761152 [Flagelloscypha sp. PMI_526]